MDRTGWTQLALTLAACIAVSLPLTFLIAWTFGALGLGYIVPPECP